MTGPADSPKIEQVNLIGETQMDRRKALQTLGLSALGTLVGIKVSGADSANVGVTGSDFAHNHSFRAIGGALDGKTLLLPSGTSLTLGPYGNPIVAPGAFHGSPLSELDPNIVDRRSVVEAHIRPKPDSESLSNTQIDQRIKDTRIWRALVQDGDGYQIFDLSKQLASPPHLKIDSNGCLEARVGGRTVISAKDGVYLREVRHVDIGRQDINGAIGVFSSGEPPTSSNSIVFTELDTPVIPVAGATEGWKGVMPNNARGLILPSGHATEIPGETFVVGGPNVWRYLYKEGDGGTVVFEAECKKHGGTDPDQLSQKWDSLGARQFYQLITEKGETVIKPEPDLRSAALEVTHLSSTGDPLFATGIVLYSLADGKVVTERTSLSNLGKKANVSVRDSVLEVQRSEGSKTYQIVELRKKPGFADNTADLYAVDVDTIKGGWLPTSPVLSSIGSYDLLAAREETGRFLSQ